MFKWILNSFFCFWVLASVAFCESQQKKPYNVISHRAFIKLYPAEYRIVVNDTLKIRATDKIGDEILLTLNPGMVVSDVAVHDKTLKFEQKREFLKIYLSEKEEFELIINYSGNISNKTEYSKFTESYAVLHESEILPLGTKSYEFTRFSVQAPSTWQVIAIGELVNRSDQNDSAITIYENREKVQTLGWICGGEYSINTRTTDGITLSTNLFMEDSSYSQEILNRLQQTLKIYSEKFSEYRFKKLSIVEVDDWVAGKTVLAAAYPSVILIKKRAFQQDDIVNNVITILPHEVAHQWWPLTVFIEDEDAALLSEGLCEYSSVLFSEWTGLAQARDSLKSHPLLRSLIMRASNKTDFPLKQKADLRSLPTHYLKGAYVHNMLRFLVGDSVYKNLLIEFAKEYSSKVTNSVEFQQLAEKMSHKKLDWFFKQWTEETGIPALKVYGVKSVVVGDAWVTQGRVRLVGYGKKFTTPMEVGVETEKGFVKQVLWLGFDTNNVYRNEASFKITTASKPYRALVDPEGQILKFRKMPPKMSDLREPSDGVMIVGTRRNSEKLLKLARRDFVEMDKAGWWIRIIADTNATLVDLQNDRVFLYGKADENRIVGDVSQKFPFKVVVDSVIINKATYSDNLTLVQIIDNPCRNQGLMCWIAPLNEQADPHLMPYDASYVVIDGKEIVEKGTWDVKDEDLEVEIR
jgi:hypothetical protein